MTDRKKDLLVLAGLLAVLIAFFAKILFTHQIIRAPDIINEFYWGVRGIGSQPFWSLFKVNLSHPGWDPLVNSGYTNEGGDASMQFLFLRNLVFWIFPNPANVAWYIVLQLFIGAAGAYCYCRLIGASRIASFLAGAVFVLAPENASLINAGHVMKIATISFAPWAFYCLEKGFKTRRLFWFLTTSLVLAYQFFHTHWQIAYYTCLAVAVYGVVRSVGILREKKGDSKEIGKLLGLNLALLVFFLGCVAMSLVPLANWSKDTNRGANSGANAAATSASAPAQPKGGLDREEAMSWSLPPEETAAFVIPGFFGYSRQEAGANPSNIASYYWGRMNFTQTLSYMGLLPWLLVPLPLIFRRNRYTLLASLAVVLGILFSMGKYTPFYNLLFDYFPGINRFRVPKMMMFMPVFGLGVLSALGLDIVLDPAVRASKAFKRYLLGLALLPAALLALLGVEFFGRDYWVRHFIDMLAQPTRYEQDSVQLVVQRYGNLMTETGIAAGLSAVFAAVFLAFQRGVLKAKALPFVLFALFLLDVGRVNSKFLFLVDEPHKAEAGALPPEMAFISKYGKEFRTLPFNGDPAPYAAAGIPVMFTSNAVQQRRWQEFLDGFNMASCMPDIMNVRFVVYGKEDYASQAAGLPPKFVPVLQTPNAVVLENKTVLPKAWLVPSAVQIAPGQGVAVLQNPGFDPRQIALVESPSPIPMAPPNTPLPMAPGQVTVTSYLGEKIDLDAAVALDSVLVMGEKYYRGWHATVDGKETEIVPVDHVLRGIYVTPGVHKVEFYFDPLPFKVGKYLTLASFLFFVVMLGRELRLCRRSLPLCADVQSVEA